MKKIPFLISSKSILKELFKFAIVGFLGALVNLLLLYIFTEYLKIYYLISEIIAIIIATIHNYLLNKLWTFKEKLDMKIITKFLKYCITSGISLILNIAILYYLVEYWNLWYFYAAIIAIACTFIWNFFSNKYWTFKKRK
ncbi:MAG: GtrA family protein [Promethearchaeia archaeon]